MKRLVFPLAGLLLAAACSDDEKAMPPTCDPTCGPCQRCDTSGATPTCVANCNPGLTCENGQCVAPAVSTCNPACANCQQCDTSGATPTCTDICATGTTCQDGQCVAPTVAKCEPACGDCQMCDTTGTTPACVDLCQGGTVCQSGGCVIPSGDPCQGACKACQRCDTDHGVPQCLDSCPADTTCDTTAQVCRPPASGQSFDHATLSQLAGPFTNDLSGMRAITAICLGCHPRAGSDMLKTAHWKWTGPTPGLQGHESGETVGKRNLINNFCIAVPSNEKRCAQCHAGYGYDGNTFDFTATNVNSIDCLACHATADYAKDPTSGGLPASTVDLALAVKSVGKPTRAACGRCHFDAGGGDNVKKGDMGSALAAPTPNVDVHMGHIVTPFSCATCHKGSAHKIVGKGVHMPVGEGRLACVDCHGRAPHTGNKTMLDNHALDVACQTCHVPAFSRQQPTKVDWDWSTAGNKTRGNGTGVEEQTVGSKTVPVYDWKKGDFVWQQNVRPSYAWYDGRVSRMTIADTYPQGKGTSSNRINLGGPVATIADLEAKIYPFKVMKGRQPVDPNRRIVIVPKLFGPGGFWGSVPAAADYTAQKVEDLWTATLTAGARYAGQLSASESYTGRGTGANQWDWGHTELWMQINHEVALRIEALGCSDCHRPSGGLDWTALGYACDPMGDPIACGSRHR